MSRAPSPSPRSDRLARDDYATGPVTLARRLLGRRLVRVLDSGARLAGVIVETEAYLGVKDRAAHTFGGRRTPRNESMYAAPGTAYVYFTYGMHHCMNVVSGAEGAPTAVLLRALEPVAGMDEMRLNRASPRRTRPLRDVDLCSGPARLCQALAIDRSLDGVDLTTDTRLFIEPSAAGHVRRGRIRRSARVGVAYAQEWADRPLRFFFADSAHVSRK